MNKIIPMPLTSEEEIVYKWQYRMMGTFYTNLMSLITLADEDNLKKLSQAYPVYVDAYLRYCHENGWWDSVQRKAYELGYPTELSSGN
jgi:hypothetical protein